MSLPLACVVAARPNFMKVGPVVLELRRRGLPLVLIHTGQHYDAAMSDVFFDQLGLPRPDVNLGVGSGSHGQQTGQVLIAFERWLQDNPVAAVLVAGDVNSTMACALAAVKLGLPVAHLEAGLRSFDRSMPEEINRLVTDAVADLLLTPSPDADAHLAAEGVPPERVVRVGNAMIDSLLAHRERARATGAVERLGLAPRRFALVTLHRPATVDQPAVLAPLLAVLRELAAELPVLFPCHPRTRARLEAAGLTAEPVRLVDPLGYLEFLALEQAAAVVLTDSGGVQEETTVFGVPCLTLRANTERPITISEGSNRLVGTDPAALRAALAELRPAWQAPDPGRLAHPPAPRVPALWDGQTAPRVVAALVARYRLSPADPR